MKRKQKKELRERQSTRQLMGISQLTDHGVKTAKGELVFFMLKPDNLSVLSPEGVVRSRSARAVTRPRTPSGDSTDRLSGLSIKKTSSPLAVFTPWSVSWLMPMS